MSRLNIPPELKKISAFVRRAEELDKDQSTPESRLVAYYCRQYAVHTGIPLASASPAAKQCLGSLLEILETEKPAMDNFTREEAKYLCKAFAEKVFIKADEEDRSGTADQNTAKTFYAAASFLQILEQFASDKDDDAELEEREENKKKVIYAKWKATEILKAVRAGVEPTPGGYGENLEAEAEVEGIKEDAQSQGDSQGASDSNTESLPPPSIPKVETVSVDESDDGDNKGDVMDIPTAPVAPPMEPPTGRTGEETNEPEEEGSEVVLGPPPAYPGSGGSSNHSEDSSSPQMFVPPPLTPDTLPQESPMPPPSIPPPAPAPSGGGLFGFGQKKGGKVSKAQIADAVELTRFALSALEEKDPDLAAERLQQALQSLGR